MCYKARDHPHPTPLFPHLSTLFCRHSTLPLFLFSSPPPHPPCLGGSSLCSTLYPSDTAIAPHFLPPPPPHTHTYHHRFSLSPFSARLPTSLTILSSTPSSIPRKKKPCPTTPPYIAPTTFRPNTTHTQTRLVPWPTDITSHFQWYTQTLPAIPRHHKPQTNQPTTTPCKQTDGQSLS